MARHLPRSQVELVQEGHWHHRPSPRDGPRSILSCNEPPRRIRLTVGPLVDLRSYGAVNIPGNAGKKHTLAHLTLKIAS